MAVHETITPSGFSIVFEDGEPDDKGKSKRRSYTVNGEKLVSVTTVLGCLDKPGLKYAAEKLGVQGAIILAQDGRLPASVDGALSRMKAEDLRFWQVWDKKKDRGTLAHEDLLALATGAPLPDLDALEPEQRGFAQGVAGWFADARPVAIQQEQSVASVEHGFAGRHDLYCTIPTLHPTARFLLDLKTTAELPRDRYENVKAPYPEMLLQLGGYEVARVESGYEPSDYQAVLRVDSTGATDLFVTVVDPSLYLGVLGAYKALKGVPTSPVEIQMEAAA
jgi:hypothetical protein